jgi:hypothetical protein
MMGARLKIFGVFDEDGYPEGFYTDDIYKPDQIPGGAIEITSDQWKEFLSHQGTRRFQDGKVVECAPKPYTGPDYGKLSNEYWLRLGQFVDAFARIERMVFMTLMVEARVDVPTARALFGTANLEQVTTLIRRTREARNDPPSPVLDRALRGLNEIRIRRNHLLHRGSQFQEDGSQIVSNALWAHKASKVDEYAISPDDLRDMALDLNTIEAGLALHMATGHVPQEFLAQSFRPAASMPWKYKGLQEPASNKPGSQSRQ